MTQSETPYMPHLTLDELMEPETCETVQETLAARGNRYGDFTVHAHICQELKRVMQQTDNYDARLNDVQRQALDVIADKIARILSGDPDYRDNWHDIQGYAKLVEDRIIPF